MIVDMIFFREFCKLKNC